MRISNLNKEAKLTLQEIVYSFHSRIDLPKVGGGHTDSIFQVAERAGVKEFLMFEVGVWKG